MGDDYDTLLTFINNRTFTFGSLSTFRIAEFLWRVYFIQNIWETRTMIYNIIFNNHMLWNSLLFIGNNIMFANKTQNYKKKFNLIDKHLSADILNVEIRKNQFQAVTSFNYFKGFWENLNCFTISTHCQSECQSWSIMHGRNSSSPLFQMILHVEWVQVKLLRHVLIRFPEEWGPE